MSPPDPLSPAALLAESAWLQRLAARLVAEPSGAADAAQETLTKALERPPAATVPLRQWLAAVLRNVVRQERRSAGRREARELARPVVLAGEPADELATRLELHERLVAAVRALDEPYRSTIALRFLEDLPPRIVAERMGVPVKTVHTRLERALEQLRARLDRERGGRKAWVGLLVPLSTVRPPLAAAAPAPAISLLAPFIAMGTLWKWTGACAALAALGFFAVRTFGPDEPRAAPPRSLAAEPAKAELVAPVTVATALPPSVEREAVVTQARGAAAVLPEPAKTAVPMLAGLVLDLERRPVAGLDVAYERITTTPSASKPRRTSSADPFDARAESDEDGSFALPIADVPRRIVAHGRGYATAIPAGLAGPPSPEPPIVFVSSERAYAGHVVDPQGAPIAGADLEIYLAEALARELTPGTFAGGLPMAQTKSDAEGRFEFPSVGRAPGSYVWAAADGFENVKLELPGESSLDLLLTLGRTPPAENALAGHVQYGDGRPASGAYVSTGGAPARTAEDGSFELALEPGARAEHVRAILAGHLPAELDVAGLTDTARAELVLVLGDEALTIAGRVLDDEGEPIAGARVWTTDGERFGVIRTGMGGLDFMLDFDVESVIAGARTPQEDGRRALSDEQGRFELTSLGERRYALFATHPRTQELVGPVEAAAGEDGVVLRLAGAEPVHAVAGQVTTLSGAPVAGAYVRVQRKIRTSAGWTRTLRVDPSFQARTDDEGLFRFDELCTAGTELLVSAQDFPSETSCALDNEPELEYIVVRLPAACHLRVFLDDPESADGLMLQDDRGENINLTMQVGGVLMMATAITLGGGVSDLITTDERARTLILHKGQEVVARIPLLLRPGEVNEVRF
jgi:RNA polymerase sigma-70 factor (ECF subfamily)